MEGNEERGREQVRQDKRQKSNLSRDVIMCRSKIKKRWEDEEDLAKGFSLIDIDNLIAREMASALGTVTNKIKTRCEWNNKGKDGKRETRELGADERRIVNGIRRRRMWWNKRIRRRSRREKGDQ
jgi:hypothetical protein